MKYIHFVLNCDRGKGLDRGNGEKPAESNATVMALSTSIIHQTVTVCQLCTDTGLAAGVIHMNKT